MSDLAHELLLPVQIIESASNTHGGLVRFPSGRELLLSKKDAAALRAPAQSADARTVETLKAVLPYLDNSDSPGGCNGKHKDCPHCAAIAKVRKALASRLEAAQLKM